MSVKYYIMSHTIIPFVNSELVTIYKNKVLINQCGPESSSYITDKLITYNLTTNVLEELYIPPSFKYFFKNPLPDPSIQVCPNVSVYRKNMLENVTEDLNKIKFLQFVGNVDDTNITIKLHKNLDLYPDLKNLLETRGRNNSVDIYNIVNKFYKNLDYYPDLGKKFLTLTIESQSQPSYHSIDMYENEGPYKIDVWYDQIYIVRLDNNITSYHINSDYELQKGDCGTCVWEFNNNFVISNDGDVSSVLLIIKNEDFIQNINTRE